MAPYLFHDPMWHWQYGSVRVGESIQESGRVEHRSVLSSISLFMYSIQTSYCRPGPRTVRCAVLSQYRIDDALILPYYHQHRLAP